MSNLIFSQASCRFGSGSSAVVALGDFSLQCHAGEITCLVGPNGAGKSTALALAAGLLPLSGGEIAFGDRNIEPTVPPLRMGYLPQISRFPAVLKAGEVMDFAARARGSNRHVRHELEQVSGLGSVRDRLVGCLSSGWVRRLGLAVALGLPADLLLLDEPFVGLDISTLDRLLVHLSDRVKQGTVVIISSHEFELIDQLDPKMAVLEGGCLRAVVPAGGRSSRALYREALASDT